jgi:hypothetical protein
MVLSLYILYIQGVTTIKQVIFKASGIAGSGEQQTSGGKVEKKREEKERSLFI